MDFALESGTAASASHRIITKRPYGVTRYYVQERGKLLWLIPFWWTMDYFFSLADAEEHLMANWKMPRYFHITRKTPS